MIQLVPFYSFDSEGIVFCGEEPGYNDKKRNFVNSVANNKVHTF